MRPIRSGVAALASAAVLAAALTPLGGAGAWAAPPSPVQPLPSGKSWQVTLFTGDVVTVRTRKGAVPSVGVRPGADRRNKVFSTSVRPDGHVVVVPADVARLRGRVVDPALFDVTALIQNGLDDARSRELPLIVQRSGRSVAAALPQGRRLASLDAVAVRQPKSGTGRLGRALAAAPGGDASHIWLDRTVHTTRAPQAPVPAAGAPSGAAKPGLDRNLTQVGAPVAWKAGATGRGVKVAVLDTGVDATHPDLKGRIAESANFSTSPDVKDRFGHGTHVAAIVAGGGNASGGSRKGVAPDARLLVGKVLNDDGRAPESQLIAGMEWAATRAKIVNMSIGGDTTDGTDPLSVALDGLSKRNGTLFVVAAGNDGAIGSVNTPGSADTALTVGAVDASDRLAPFSSRGPRAGRTAAKPELVAPGVDIVAARATGTSLGRIISARYTALSGTSMATPHVAGAAALVAQKHPGWGGDQLKAALVGSAATAKDRDAYEVGAGRLDAGAAVTAPLLSRQAVPHLGTSAFPAHPALGTKLAWSAPGKAVTASLSVTVTDRQGRTVAGAAKLSATRLAIPAGGTATAQLTVKVPRPGLYAAEVTATGGGHSARTPVTFAVEAPSHTVTVVGKPIPGTAAKDYSGSASVVNLDDVAQFAQGVDVPADGGTKVRVPDGRYSVIGSVGDSRSDLMRTALAGTPEITVDRDVTVTLDGTAARPFGASVQGVATKTAMSSLSVVRSFRQGIIADGVYTADSLPGQVFAQPMPGRLTTGSITTATGFRLTAPGAVYDLFYPRPGGVPADASHVVTPAEQAKMARIDQRFAALDGDTSKPVSDVRYALAPNAPLSVGFQAGSEVPSGTTRTDYVSASPGVLWMHEAFPRAVADGGWGDLGDFAELKPGSRAAETWGRQPFRPGPYSGTGHSESGCAPAPSLRTSGNVHVHLVDLQVRRDGFDCDMIPTLKHTMTLSEGTRRIGQVASAAADFPVPARAATFTLRYETDSSSVLQVSPRTSTTWTFRSGVPSGTSSERLPLLLVDYDLSLDLRNQPTGAPATFTVARMAGSARATATGLAVERSVDGGKTWHAATVRALGGGKFSAALPKPAAGGSLSLRVTARDSGGSSVRQEIISAYRLR
ncbi:S8 family peptidase [Actinomadura rupiterrae]|uniref:S8 family peptidase n=1 Tax=Actinomadura rupiterrae TaxID=559627 RepID=UPI0020A34348|nr:S8 family serine peptidase [Actinomadura rupiterrae]MCP2341891.1 subtilisin family serine protease [Actinomadura rupiterrae]